MITCALNVRMLMDTQKKPKNYIITDPHIPDDENMNTTLEDNLNITGAIPEAMESFINSTVEDNEDRPALTGAIESISDANIEDRPDNITRPIESIPDANVETIPNANNIHDNVEAIPDTSNNVEAIPDISNNSKVKCTF